MYGLWNKPAVPAFRLGVDVLEPVDQDARRAGAGSKGSSYVSSIRLVCFRHWISKGLGCLDEAGGVSYLLAHAQTGMHVKEPEDVEMMRH